MIECKYNPFILCSGQKLYHDDAECDRCAWNPWATEIKRRVIKRTLCVECADALQITTPGESLGIGKCPNCGKWALLGEFKVEIRRKGAGRNGEGGR